MSLTRLQMPCVCFNIIVGVFTVVGSALGARFVNLAVAREMGALSEAQHVKRPLASERAAAY